MARPADQSASAAGGTASLRRTITIDPQVGERFALAPASAAPRLTAQQAWARAIETCKDEKRKSDMQVRLMQLLGM